MLVYVLLQYDYDWCNIIDVYDNEEKAISVKEYHEALEESWEAWEKCQYYIIEKEIKH